MQDTQYRDVMFEKEQNLIEFEIFETLYKVCSASNNANNMNYQTSGSSMPHNNPRSARNSQNSNEYDFMAFSSTP